MIERTRSGDVAGCVEEAEEERYPIKGAEMSPMSCETPVSSAATIYALRHCSFLSLGLVLGPHRSWVIK